MTLKNNPKLIFVANTSWYLYNFRCSLMEKMSKFGYHVIAMAPEDDYSQNFNKIGIEYIDIPISRRGKNPIKDIMLLIRLIKLYKRERPHLVHHFTPKIVIYGTIAARVVCIKSIINSVTGLGYAFIKGRILLRIVKMMYKIAFKGSSQIIFQNPDDMELFIQNKIISPERTHLIKGSGVNTEYFSPFKKKTPLNDNIIFTLISRMIWDKGVGAFVEAAKLVKKKYSLSKFLLVGDSDKGNPNAVPKKYLEEQKEYGYITWIGQINDVRPLIAEADVVVLPTTYREGVPRSLIEGASMAKPLIATDVPGCREIIEHGVNGFLVPPRDVKALVKAMLKLAKNPELRYQMGQNGRKKTLEEFDEKIVIQKTLEAYRKAGLNLL